MRPFFVKGRFSLARKEGCTCTRGTDRIQNRPQKRRQKYAVEFATDEQGVIIHASKRKGYDAPTYILDFQQEGDELVSLMLMLILISREFEC